MISAMPVARSLFTVRLALLADIPVLAHHRAAMFRDMGKLASHQQAPLERETTAYLTDALPSGDYLAWVAEDSGASVIGGAGAQLRPLLPRPRPDSDDLELGPEAIVLNVYVEPAWRLRGVAESLMRALLQALDTRGIRRIVLHASDDGRGLYDRLGFKPTNEMMLGAAKQP
jgi:ribosomal protein S18 acetylase RimI-like enzyme